MMIIIIIERPKQVMHNAVARHPLTDAQSVPELFSPWGIFAS